MTCHFKRHLQNDGKKECRNTKLEQEMELFAHVWKSCGAYAHKEDDMKQTKGHDNIV